MEVALSESSSIILKQGERFRLGKAVLNRKSSDVTLDGGVKGQDVWQKLGRGQGSVEVDGPHDSPLVFLRAVPHKKKVILYEKRRYSILWVYVTKCLYCKEFKKFAKIIALNQIT